MTMIFYYAHVEAKIFKLFKKFEFRWTRNNPLFPKAHEEFAQFVVEKMDMARPKYKQYQRKKQNVAIPIRL